MYETHQFLPAATELGQGNIFTSVCLSTGGGGLVWSRGVSNFSGGLQFFRAGWRVVCLHFFAGGLQFFWRSPNFRGSSNFFFKFFPKISSGIHLPETVNARPVHILLECILVQCVIINQISSYLLQHLGMIMI